MLVTSFSERGAKVLIAGWAVVAAAGQPTPAPPRTATVMATAATAALRGARKEVMFIHGTLRRHGLFTIRHLGQRLGAIDRRRPEVTLAERAAEPGQQITMDRGFDALGDHREAERLGQADDAGDQRQLLRDLDHVV